LEALLSTAAVIWVVLIRVRVAEVITPGRGLHPRNNQKLTAPESEHRQTQLTQHATNHSLSAAVLGLAAAGGFLEAALEATLVYLRASRHFCLSSIEFGWLIRICFLPSVFFSVLW
jgi:hypothetical protein